jgi:hypothetical protein
MIDTKTVMDQQVQRSTRNGTIDLVRLLGAISIVYFHMGLPLREYALSALPMFIVLLTYYGSAQTVTNRFNRLMLPWIFWSAVFATLKLGEILVGGSSLAKEFHWWMLFTGPSIHLWFLPFSFAFLAAFRFVTGKLKLTLLVLTSVASYLTFSFMELSPPFAQWFSVWPAAAVGIVMYNSKRPELSSLIASFVFLTLLLSPFIQVLCSCFSGPLWLQVAWHWRALPPF